MARHMYALYGSTSKTGSVPSARNAGPIFSNQNALILSESFTALQPTATTPWLEARMRMLLSSDEYVETWRIWNCYEQAWVDIALEMHRFEMFDLVVRRQDDAICTWFGAIDTHGQIEPSPNPDECEHECWQWLRFGRTPDSKD